MRPGRAVKTLLYGCSISVSNYTTRKMEIRFMQTTKQYIFSPNESLLLLANTLLPNESYEFRAEVWPDFCHDRVGDEQTREEVESAFWALFIPNRVFMIPGTALPYKIWKPSGGRGAHLSNGHQLSLYSQGCLFRSGYRILKVCFGSNPACYGTCWILNPSICYA